MCSSYPIVFSTPYRAFAEECRRLQVYNDPPVVMRSTLGTEVEVAGLPRPVVSFMTFDYLGLGHHTGSIASLARNAKECGTGFATSRVTIDSFFHQELEEALACFKRAETGTCVITSTGYGANQLIIPLLAEPIVALGKRYPKRRKKLFFVDAQSHASLHDALLGAISKYPKSIKIKKYRHLDYGMLEEMTREVSSEGNTDRFIVSDTLFSIGGDCADTKKLLAIAKCNNAFLILDGAHSDGVCGHEGRGLVEEQGIIDPKDLQYIFHTGTFSKMFAGLGGFITVSKPLAELCRNSQWSYIFSAPLPTFLVRSYQEILGMVMGKIGNRRRLRLKRNFQMLWKRLSEEGFQMLPSQSQILSVVIGSESLCLEVQQYLLREQGILSGAIRTPATERGKAVLRHTVSALHTEEQLETLVLGLKKARDAYRF
ncbi:MAG: pyridoxal phosphate-dependent aminotransferase family protein [Candidatus Moranbacteria bacterium]|nr:pyridoxal phosphate-dependent aminotransferase family protein [Candidatus Moranbacteria bacterium]